VQVFDVLATDRAVDVVGEDRQQSSQDR